MTSSDRDNIRVMVRFRRPRCDGLKHCITLIYVIRCKDLRRAQSSLCCQRIEARSFECTLQLAVKQSTCVLSGPKTNSNATRGEKHAPIARRMAARSRSGCAHDRDPPASQCFASRPSVSFRCALKRSQLKIACGGRIFRAHLTAPLMSKRPNKR